MFKNKNKYITKEEYENTKKRLFNKIDDLEIKLNTHINNTNEMIKKVKGLYKSNPIKEQIGQPKKYSLEETFDLVFDANREMRKIKPKDRNKFLGEMLLYRSGKLSPDKICEKYNFGLRVNFTQKVIWEFYAYGHDYRTDHMKKYGKVPKRLVAKGIK